MHSHSHSHGDHGHDHGHSHGDDEEHHNVMMDEDEDVSSSSPLPKSAADRLRAKRALTIALSLCLIFMFVEFIGGLMAHSLALMTDAAHLLTDVFAIGMSLVALNMAEKSADQKYTYGWHRAEVIGAFGSVLTIWALVGMITYEAFSRIVQYVQCQSADQSCEEVDGKTMTVVGIIGLFINVVVAFVLMKGGAGHGHSHGGGHSHADHKDGDHGHSHNLNVHGAFLHALGDCVQSCGVILSAIIIWVGGVGKTSKYNIADPLCSLIFAVVTLWTTKSLFKNLWHILMETVPGSVAYETLKTELQNLTNVQSVHDLHVWSLTNDKLSLSVHLVVGGDQLAHRTALEDAQDVCRKHGIRHTTIQIDTPEHHVGRCESDLACA